MSRGTLIPVNDYLAPLPATLAAQAGTQLIHSSDGSTDGVGRLIYMSGTWGNLFYGYDTWTDGWIQLTGPGAYTTGGGRAACMCSMRRVIYHVFTPNAPGVFVFRRYNIDTDTWTTLASPAGYAGAWGTDAAIVHICRTDNASVSDDNIYLISPSADNAGLRVYRYNIAADTWTSLDGAGGARAAAPGAGCTLDYLPSRSTNILYSLRAGGSAVMDTYTISTDTWGTQTYVPALANIYNTGTSSIMDPDIPAIIAYYHNYAAGAGTRIGPGLNEFYFDPTMVCRPAGHLVGAINTTAHVGKMGCFVRPVDGYAWYYLLKHSERSFQRVLRAH